MNGSLWESLEKVAIYALVIVSRLVPLKFAIFSSFSLKIMGLGQVKPQWSKRGMTRIKSEVKVFGPLDSSHGTHGKDNVMFIILFPLPDHPGRAHFPVFLRGLFKVLIMRNDLLWCASSSLGSLRRYPCLHEVGNNLSDMGASHWVTWRKVAKEIYGLCCVEALTMDWRSMSTVAVSIHYPVNR